MNNFSVTERRVGDVTVLDIRGTLSGLAGSGTLRDAINRLPQEGRVQILLNLAHVSDIDSSCLGVFLESHFDLDGKGGRLKMVHVNDKLMGLMTLTRLLPVFDVYEDESSAVDSFMIVTAEFETRSF